MSCANYSLTLLYILSQNLGSITMMTNTSPAKLFFKVKANTVPVREHFPEQIQLAAPHLNIWICTKTGQILE